MVHVPVASLAAAIGRDSSHDEVRDLLLANSNLPGPRANLELAAAFADSMMAALAHPPILLTLDNVRYCLRAASTVFDSMLASPRARGERKAFDALVKTMEYAPSVFVDHLPEEGFQVLATWAENRDKLAQRIVRANLSKARLRKRYPEAVRRLQ